MAQIHLLPEIPQKTWDALKRKLKRSEGKLVLLVHPTYSVDAPKKYYQVIQRLLRQSKTPVVVLQEFHRTNEIETGPLGPLVIPTRMGYPHPLISEKGKGTIDFPYAPPGTYDAGHKILASALEKAGAKTILIGGMKTEVHEPITSAELSVVKHEKEWLPKSRQRSRKVITGFCVGKVYGDLIHADKFERVRLMPEAVYPEKPLFFGSEKARRKPESKR